MKQALTGIVILFLLTTCSLHDQKSMDVLILINSGSSEAGKANEYLVPYLDHFGIPYHLLDIRLSPLPAELGDHALFIIGHPGISEGIDKDQLVRLIQLATRDGSGIVNFDPGISFTGNEVATEIHAFDWIIFDTLPHFITSSHRGNDTLKFYNPLKVEVPLKVPDDVRVSSLIMNGHNPLLIIEEAAIGKLVTWTSMDWMHSDICGPVKGLDDCLWKSFVWAARKPFIMHALPPVVTMRVDDVAGRGELWNRSPLYWIETANQYGFRPWLGLFIYNLNPFAISEMRSYLTSHQATAFPHAFGRPNRLNNRMESYFSGNPLDTVPFYYYPEAMSPRAETYDEFIYYDHHNGRPWTDEEALRGLNAVKEWYDNHQPLPVSSVLIPHWYEMGENCAGFIKNTWESDLSCFAKLPDRPYSDSVPWLVAGPFRLYEKPGSSTAWTRPGGQRPVYYADFLTLDDQTFFNCLTEIRDDAGYEWAPDNDVEATVGRGIRQLERAMNSLSLAVLFTHETDYIYRITPENWDQELKGISEGIGEYNPRYMLLDDAIRLVQTYITARPESASFNPRNGKISIRFAGYSDTTSSFTLFTAEGNRIVSEHMDIKSFREDTLFNLKLLVNSGAR